MIEVEYFYFKNSTQSWEKAYAYFSNVNSAVRFMYKCLHSKNMRYDGTFSCDNAYETEQIVRKFR